MRAASPIVRLALGFSASAFLLGLSGPASAQLVEPGEVVADPLKKVKEVVNKATTEAEETLDEATDQVDEVVEETTQKVDETVSEVKETVDEVAGQPAPTEPTGPGTSVDPPAGEGPRVTEPRPDNERPAPEQGPADRVKSTHVSKTNVAALRDRPYRIEPPLVPSSLELMTSTASDAQPKNLASPPRTPGEAAEQLAFPLFMILAVVAFLLVQGRFDRRDPKLLFNDDVHLDSLSFE